MSIELMEGQKLKDIKGNTFIVEKGDFILEEDSLHEAKPVKGKKSYYRQDNVGSSKYTVNFYDGEKTYKDGSPFYDIKILSSKEKLNSFLKDLKDEGYLEESTIKEASLKENSVVDLAADVADATDANDHTGAILLVAEYFKYKKYVKILNAISDIHEAEGSMPKLLGDYRSTISKEVLALVKKEESKEDFDLIDHAF